MLYQDVESWERGTGQQEGSHRQTEETKSKFKEIWMDNRKYSESFPPVSQTSVDTQGSWWKVFLQVDGSQ